MTFKPLSLTIGLVLFITEGCLTVVYQATYNGKLIVSAF
jgi:hypothetical protein